MNLVARLGYVAGGILLGAMVFIVAAGNRSSSRSAPVEKLAGELSEAWAPYHNR